MVLIQFAAFAYMGWRWHNIAVDGIPYQWRAVPRLELSSFGTDYIRVVFRKIRPSGAMPMHQKKGSRFMSIFHATRQA